MSLLHVESLTKTFGGLTAVLEVNMDIEKEELIGLIGPNGAGKTTLFNLLTGVYEPTKGKIEFEVDGKTVSLVKKKPYQITQLGFARTFQNIRLFKEMSVIDNVKIAMNKDIKVNTLQSILRTKKFYDSENEIEAKAYDILKIVGLEEKKDTIASNLPYGAQRKLEIARALATNPKILFLDEPAAGMNPNETKELTDLIFKIKNDLKITIILIEHDMSLVMTICERIYVLDYGRLIANGTPAEIKNNKRVIEAYLGE